MTDPLYVSKKGRTRMLRHLVNDHGMGGEYTEINMEELAILWWLHGHELNETMAVCN